MRDYYSAVIKSEELLRQPKNILLPRKYSKDVEILIGDPQTGTNAAFCFATATQNTLLISN